MAVTWIAAVGISSGLLAVATIFVGLRIWVRAYVLRQSIKLADYVLVVGWFVALAKLVCNAISMREFERNGSERTSDLQLKIQYASTLCTEIGLYFPKASIVLFYWKLFPWVFRGLRISMYVVVGYVCIAALITTALDLFWCVPITSNWSQTPGVCSVWNSWTTWDVNWGLNITSDVAIFVLPFFLLQHLTIPSRQKWGLALTFSVGAMTIIVSTARYVWFFFDLAVPPGYIWVMAEMCTAIISACLPSLKPLLKLKSLPNSKAATNET